MSEETDEPRAECSISSQFRELAGLCSMCHGKDYVVVFVVQLRNLEFRLCNQCRKALAEVLN